MGKILQNQQAQEIVKRIQEKYGDELEFLWQKFPEDAIVRNKKNRKWYALFMTIPRSKLGLDSEREVQIMDVRFDKGQAPDFAASNENVFPGYHMNKNNWITVILDGSMATEQILGLLGRSYEISLRS